MNAVLLGLWAITTLLLLFILFTEPGCQKQNVDYGEEPFDAINRRIEVVEAWVA